MKLERRSFVTLSAMALIALATLKGKLGLRIKRERKKVTLLSQEGKLVTVDQDNLPFTRKRASKAQLVSWIWKDQKL